MPSYIEPLHLYFVRRPGEDDVDMGGVCDSGSKLGSGSAEGY